MKMTHLTLRVLTGANAEASLSHRLLNDADRIRRLCRWINTFLRDKSGDFFTDGSEIMLALLLANLELARLQDLQMTLRRRSTLCSTHTHLLRNLVPI